MTLCLGLLFFATTVLLAVSGGPVQKATIKGSTDVSALSDKSDTFDGKIVNKGDVKGNYKGKNGWIKSGKGDVEGSQTGNGEKFEAYGPNGAKDKQTGTLDKKTNTANVVSSGGDKIIANAATESDMTAKVNGKKTYEITKDKNGNVEVYPNSKTSAHSLTGVKDKGGEVRIKTPKQPEHVERTRTILDENGKIAEVRNSDAENTIPGIDLGTKNDARMYYQGSSDSDLQVGKSVGSTNNDKLAASLGAGVSSGQVTTKPCLTNPDGTDYFGDSGFSIDDKKTRFELIKDSAGAYVFPSCFNVFASVFIPAGVDTAQLAAYAKVRSVVAGGEMQCDPKVACLDKTTANRPPGSCFFCDFCDKKQPQGAFGLESESNFCTAKAGKSLPLTWKICPPEQSGSKFIPFLPTGEKTEGDIVSQVSIYLRKSKKWVMVACKQSVYPFRAGIADGPGIGSKESIHPLTSGGSKTLSNVFAG